MQQLNSLHRLKTALAASLVLALAWLIAPSLARAECGDYVAINGASHQPRSEPTAPMQAPARPCQGPMCSKNHLPAPTPAVPANISAQDLSYLNLAEFVSDEEVSAFVGDDGIEVPSGGISGIFRPPR